MPGARVHLLSTLKKGGTHCAHCVILLTQYLSNDHSDESLDRSSLSSICQVARDLLYNIYMCVCITNRVPSDDLYLSDNQSGVSSGIYSTQITNIHKIVGNIHVRRGVGCGDLLP